MHGGASRQARQAAQRRLAILRAFAWLERNPRGASGLMARDERDLLGPYAGGLAR